MGWERITEILDGTGEPPKYSFLGTLLGWKYLQRFKLPVQPAWNNQIFIANYIRIWALKTKQLFQLCSNSWSSEFWFSDVPLGLNLIRKKCTISCPHISVSQYYHKSVWGFGQWLALLYYWMSNNKQNQTALKSYCVQPFVVVPMGPGAIPSVPVWCPEKNYMPPLTHISNEVHRHCDLFPAVLNARMRLRY